MTVRVTDDLRDELGRAIPKGEINAFVREAIAEKLSRSRREEEFAAMRRLLEEEMRAVTRRIEVLERRLGIGEN